MKEPGTNTGAPAPGTTTTRGAEFRRVREKNWRHLEDIIARVDKKGLRSLSADEVLLLPRLYRSALSSLSVARHIVLDRNLLVYLEDLSLRAYLVVYGPSAGLMKSLAGFFKTGFPRAVRGLGPHLALAALLFAAGTAAGFFLVQADPDYFNLLAPKELAGGRGPDLGREELLSQEIFAPWPGFTKGFIVFANALFRHNSIVGLLAFSLGFALGLPTLFLIITNGLVMGAFLALHAGRQLTVDFLGWVSIHGVTEILAVLLCGAAGFRLAEIIVFPGRWPRLVRLAREGRQAAGVAAGAAVLFFIASLLEGGCRQLIGWTPGRLAVAGLTGAGWLAYFLRGGRSGADDRPD